MSYIRYACNHQEFVEDDRTGPTSELLVRCPTCIKKELGPNPKDLVGAKKVSISKVPFTSILMQAHAMMNGATKYGPFNWRKNKVIASIYIDAAIRHLMLWVEGEEIASDSGVHHLGHALASIGIIVDAQATGNLVDDRPEGGTLPFTRLMEKLNSLVKEKSNG